MPGEIEILARAHALFAGAPGAGLSAGSAGAGPIAAAVPAIVLGVIALIVAIGRFGPQAF